MSGLTLLTAASDPSSSLNPTVLLTWLTCLATLGGAVVMVLKYGRRVMQMVEDFNGTADRPGVPARPGVMQRLQLIETEITPNHGSSIKDAVNRIDAQVIVLQTDLKGVHDRLDANVQGPS